MNMNTLLLLAIAVAFGLLVCAGPPSGNASNWFHYGNTWEGKGIMESCTCDLGIWSSELV